MLIKWTGIQQRLGGIKTMRLYIDPATTSYLVQIIAGVVIALGAAAGIFFSKIKRLFKKEKSEPESKQKNDTGEKKIVTADDLLDDEE